MCSDPTFYRAVSDFLLDPVIRLEPSEKVARLERQLDELRRDYSKLQLEHERMKSMYHEEMQRVFYLQDICREHGIHWR